MFVLNQLTGGPIISFLQGVEAKSKKEFVLIDETESWDSTNSFVEWSSETFKATLITTGKKKSGVGIKNDETGLIKCFISDDQTATFSFSTSDNTDMTTWGTNKPVTVNTAHLTNKSLTLGLVAQLFFTLSIWVL